MNITDYAKQHRTKSKGKVKSAIAQRWNTRVVPQGLDQRGKDGAQAYLDAYGKGVGAPKVIELAICAETMNAHDMAAGFWEAAFYLETGNQEAFTAASGSSTPNQVSGAPTRMVQANTTKASTPPPNMPEFPAHLQPGSIQTMQPIDPPVGHDQNHFIDDDSYLGQAKRDGHRNVLFATPGLTFHQSRSTNSLGIFDQDFEEAAKLAAKDCGPFVLDGERYYRSVGGSEHRSAAQAATINAELGQPTVLPVPVYAAFEALFVDGRDLTWATKEERIAAAAGPIAILNSYLPDGCRCQVEHLKAAITTREKEALVRDQQSNGREGEVWTHAHAPYQGGKDHKCSIRTKYLSEGIFTIIGVKKSTSSNRSIASFELADSSGKAVGSVGTGFDDALGKKLEAAHLKNPGTVKVEVRHQGYTETGQLWHSRMI